MFTGVLTVFGALVIPETYAPVLLRARADTLSKATGKVYRSKQEKDQKVILGQLFKTALGRPWLFLFKEPIVFLLSLYLAIVYATLYVSDLNPIKLTADALWCFPHRLRAAPRLEPRYRRSRFPRRPRRLLPRHPAHHLHREPALRQESRRARWMAAP